MKDYSRLKWFLFIPWIGLGIIFFSVASECRFRITKFWGSFMLALFIPAVLGALIGELIFYFIAEEIVYEWIIRMIILLLFLHLGAFIWCLIVSRKRKNKEQATKKTETENHEGGISKMKDYSKIRWFLLIPILGVFIVVFLVWFKDQYQPTKHYIRMFLWLGLSGVIGAIAFVIARAVIIAVSGSISDVVTIILVLMIFVFMNIGMFIWCSLVARKRKTEEWDV